MAYTRKTRDIFVLQANHGYGDGWEDETTELTRSEIRERLKEYRANAPRASYRIQKRREPIEAA